MTRPSRCCSCLTDRYRAKQSHPRSRLRMGELAPSLVMRLTSFLVGPSPLQCSCYSRRQSLFFSLLSSLSFPYHLPHALSIASLGSDSPSKRCPRPLHAHVFHCKGPVVARSRHNLKPCDSPRARRWSRQDGLQQSPKCHLGRGMQSNSTSPPLRLVSCL